MGTSARSAASSIQPCRAAPEPRRSRPVTFAEIARATTLAAVITDFRVRGARDIGATSLV